MEARAARREGVCTQRGPSEQKAEGGISGMKGEDVSDERRRRREREARRNPDDKEARAAADVDPTNHGGLTVAKKKAKFKGSKKRSFPRYARTVKLMSRIEAILKEWPTDGSSDTDQEADVSDACEAWERDMAELE